MGEKRVSGDEVLVISHHHGALENRTEILPFLGITYPASFPFPGSLSMV
ncbi:hypothetical protein ASZ90_014738 [hydrocarbon metagenome]|uniref:Uncharacterized protein n=1 Tax=hydrocarbon metagenome TaxID=938273 RepID=A0A0W8F3W3_9ZZZZ